jgi:zinc transport system substrate-binding protein
MSCKVRKIACFLVLILIISCGRQSKNSNERIITVSIAPFSYFVKAISGNDFKVNVMVPAGSDPHVYEPFPEQISKLRKSVGYISNGYLGFEMNWLDRFYESNRSMKKLSLGNKINPIVSEHQHEGEHVEGADPHYWVSPKSGYLMASEVKDFLIMLNPNEAGKYQAKYDSLILRIQGLDRTAESLFSTVKNKSVLIYHPNLAYLSRDYGLTEIPVEFEGKEPPPSRLRELIDLARKENIKTIFIQREYDTKNAKAIAKEIGADLIIIDPLSEDWLTSTSDIINAVYKSLTESVK